MSSSTLSAEQRSALLAAKLRALVSRHPDGAPAATEVGSLPGGVTLVGDGRGWVYRDDDPHRGVGAALAWARRRGVSLELVEDGPGPSLTARRAQAFREPPPVWAVVGTELAPVAAAPFPPLPAAAPEEASTLVALLEAAGVDVVVEQDLVVGEVLGLEVARIVPSDDGTVRLEVGVGQADREFVGMLHSDRSAAESLAAVIDVVRTHRSATAQPHPLNRLSPERWLRSMLTADPGRIGLSGLRPLPSLSRRRGLRETEPAPALGATGAGAPVVVVCSVGIDLDLVPAAAETHRWWSGAHGIDPADVPLVLVVPDRDAHPAIADLAAALAVPADIRTVPSDWRA